MLGLLQFYFNLLVSLCIDLSRSHGWNYMCICFCIHFIPKSLAHFICYFVDGLLLKKSNEYNCHCVAVHKNTTCTADSHVGTNLRSSSSSSHLAPANAPKKRKRVAQELGLLHELGVLEEVSDSRLHPGMALDIVAIWGVYYQAEDFFLSHSFPPFFLPFSPSFFLYNAEFLINKHFFKCNEYFVY